MPRLAIAAYLILALSCRAALAAGSEPATPEPEVAPAPAVTSVTIAPPQPSTAVTTKPRASKAVNPSVDWTKKWGDLGEAYKAAKKLIDAEQYAQAIAALQALNKPEDPRVLNWIAYSNRKLGNTDEAIQIYTQALTIAPDFTPAHEYLGEAYIQGHDIAKAKAQLATIEQLCGNQTCKEYSDLRRSLDRAARSRGASADLKGSSK